jgi:hypothetical protein
MKRNITIFFVLLTSLLFAQEKDKSKMLYTDLQVQDNYAQAQKLKNSTLLVIIDDMKSASGKKFMNSIDKNWSFNPHRFVKGDSIEQYISNPNYSILTIFHEGNEDKKTPQNGYYLGVYIGDEKNKSFAAADEFTSIGLPGKKEKTSLKTDSVLKENSYLFSFFIKHLQNEVEKALQKTNTKVIPSFKCTYYDNGKEVLANKTILIAQEGIDAKFNPKAFLKNFNLSPEQLKIVDSKEIETALSKQNDKIAFAYDFTGGTGKIFDAGKNTLLAEGYAKSTLRNKIIAYTVAPVFILLLVLVLTTYK